MNDTFNITRFGWLFRKSILERPTLILGSIAATMAITFLCYAFVQATIGVERAQVVSFMAGFFIGGSLMASSVFNYFSSNASGSSFLMLPASHFEKWLCGILTAGVLFTLIFLGFYRVIDIFFVNHYRNGLDPNSPGYQNLYHSVDVFAFDNRIAQRIYLMYVNVGATMLLGSLYFKKVSYIKVALIICTFVGCTYLLNLVFITFLFKHVDAANPFDHVFLKVGNEVGLIGLPYPLDNAFHILSLYIVPAILLLVAYLRLTEKEF
ncbi:hypothetical protein [Pedobacter sp. L105]|uniref:hypothetical protein n=1 Tax=Pedobacter sp. L105 TaxID=1641871 RepID=UPI00131C1489|nr:hypothetical protein [Pedobacter sp. L105]